MSTMRVRPACHKARRPLRDPAGRPVETTYPEKVEIINPAGRIDQAGKRSSKEKGQAPIRTAICTPQLTLERPPKPQNNREGDPGGHNIGWAYPRLADES